jgi:hypothetical protein
MKLSKINYGIRPDGSKDFPGHAGFDKKSIKETFRILERKKKSVPSWINLRTSLCIDRERLMVLDMTWRKYLGTNFGVT